MLSFGTTPFNGGKQSVKPHAVIIKSNVFISPFVHQLISQSAVQKPSLKPQTDNAGVEARWLP
jgi:hypothetical protein